MTPLASTLSGAHPLRTAFMKWQCLVRQIAMRENEGRPDDAIMPTVFLAPEAEAQADAPTLGHIITVLNKAPALSVTAELRHMAAKTNDPAQIRDAALRYLSATYYQKHAEFSDILTAAFVSARPGRGASAMPATARCALTPTPSGSS